MVPEVEKYRSLLQRPTLQHYQQVLETLVRDISAERGCFWLERENKLLYCGDEELHLRFPFSRQAVDSVLDHGRSFVSYDTETDERLRPSGSIKMNHVRSCLCAACQDANANVLVVAYFDNGMSAGPFAESDLTILRGVLSLVPDAVPVLT